MQVIRCESLMADIDSMTLENFDVNERGDGLEHLMSWILYAWC